MDTTRKISVNGKEVSLRVSDAIPGVYREKFGRDFYEDLNELKKKVSSKKSKKSTLDVFTLEMFENIAYVMAKHADDSIPNSLDEWLDKFNGFSIYQILPEIIKLGNLTQK